MGDLFCRSSKKQMTNSTRLKNIREEKGYVRTYSVKKNRPSHKQLVDWLKNMARNNKTRPCSHGVLSEFGVYCEEAAYLIETLVEKVRRNV